MSALHSEPLPTDEVEIFAKVVPEAYQDLFDVFSEKRLRTWPPHREFDHELHIKMTRYLPIATSTALWHRAWSPA